MFKNILLAVDGSQPALKAASVAGNLARELGSNIRLITIFDHVPSYLGDPYIQHALSERMKAAEKVLDSAISALGDVPTDIKSDVLEGPPAEAILHVAANRPIDLIIMGSRGLGTLTGLLLGSQSQKVVNHAPCPVLIVR